METRKLPALSERAETGPMKFGGDWTGVFIRGDNALAYVCALESLLNTREASYQIVELIELLRSCAE